LTGLGFTLNWSESKRKVRAQEKIKGKEDVVRRNGLLANGHRVFSPLSITGIQNNDELKKNAVQDSRLDHGCGYSVYAGGLTFRINHRIQYGRESGKSIQ